MSNQKPIHLPADICPCFWTKTMQLNTEYRRSEHEEGFVADTAIFNCLVTMRTYGPDQGDVEPVQCRPGRACYQVDDTHIT